MSKLLILPNDIRWLWRPGDANGGAWQGLFEREYDGIPMDTFESSILGEIGQKEWL